MIDQRTNEQICEDGSMIPADDVRRELKYRKKPVVIEAVQWTGRNIEEVLPFFGDITKLPSDGVHVHPGIGHCPPEGTLDIPTLEGTMTASAGDWIIKGIKGEFYPCKPDIFEQTYEPADRSGQLVVPEQKPVAWQAVDPIEASRVELESANKLDKIDEFIERELSKEKP